LENDLAKLEGCRQNFSHGRVKKVSKTCHTRDWKDHKTEREMSVKKDGRTLSILPGPGNLFITYPPPASRATLNQTMKSYLSCFAVYRITICSFSIAVTANLP
jgi:hypothetical protein